LRPQIRELLKADPDFLPSVVRFSQDMLEASKYKYPKEICASAAARLLYLQYPEKTKVVLEDNGQAFLVVGAVSDHQEPHNTIKDAKLWVQWLVILNQPQWERMARAVLVKTTEPRPAFHDASPHWKFFSDELSSLHDEGIIIDEVPYGDRCFRNFRLHVIFLVYSADNKELMPTCGVKDQPSLFTREQLLMFFSGTRLNQHNVSYNLTCNTDLSIRPPAEGVAIAKRVEEAKRQHQRGLLTKEEYKNICIESGAFGLPLPCKYLNDALAGHFFFLRAWSSAFGTNSKFLCRRLSNVRMAAGSTKTTTSLLHPHRGSEPSPRANGRWCPSRQKKIHPS
jgi:hypothetical protein